MDWREEALKRLERMPPEAKEIRETAKNDLFFYAQLVNPGFMYGDVHKEIFQWMQEYSLFGIESEKNSNKLIMLPRAHLKSHMVATWSSWIVVRHPEVTLLYLSATSGLAEKQLYAIKNIFESKVFNRYFPEYINPQEGKREKWTNTEIAVDHIARSTEGVRDPTIATAGLTTNTTGWHADIIVPDDLVVPENAYTEGGRELVVSKSSQFTSIRNTGGFTMACGTRYHPNDVYATWKAQEYDVYSDDDELLERRPVWSVKEYAVEEEGVFLWPRVVRPDGKKFGFDRRELARIKAEYEDRVQFHAQYYNNPNDPGSNRINRDRFQYYDKKFLRQSEGYWYYRSNRLNIYSAIDFAFSLGKSSDDSAIVVIGIDEVGFIYVLDIEVFKTDRISGYFDVIKHLHSKWEFNKLRAETTVAQAIIVRDLKDKLREEGLRLSVDEFRPSRKEGTKEERIAAALEHRYDSQSIWHFKGGYNDVLEEQLILARPAHDDVKDALASAIEIAVKPRGSRGDRETSNVIKFNSRFGGVAFK